MNWLAWLLVLAIGSHGIAIFSDTRFAWWFAGFMTGLVWAGIGIERFC
jgi:hypothetical protein